MEIYEGIEDYVKKNGELPKSLQKIKREKIKKLFEQLMKETNNDKMETIQQEIDDLCYELGIEDFDEIL